MSFLPRKFPVVSEYYLYLYLFMWVALGHIHFGFILLHFMGTKLWSAFNYVLNSSDSLLRSAPDPTPGKIEQS